MKTSTKGHFAFVALIAGPVFYKNGISLGSIVAVLLVATLAVISWYFDTRDSSSEPSLFERIFASLWLWFRRVVGIGAGAIFLWAGWGISRSAATSNEALSPFVTGALLALVGFFCIYVGIIGQGWNRSDWRDDVTLHRHNKRRYKWWF